MRKRLFIYVGVGLLVLLYLLVKVNHHQALEETARAEHLFVSYTTWNGVDVDMVNDANRIGLRLMLNDELTPAAALGFLKEQVEYLSTGELVALGKTGYTFRMNRGKPTLDSCLASGERGAQYQYLYFATGAKVSSTKLIEAMGRTN